MAGPGIQDVGVRRSRRTRLAVMVALAATLIAQFAAVTPANAWTTTCTDSGCPNSAAWDSARWTSWWGNHVTGSSTAGANCTNYAAWKLSQNGVSRVDGLGNAQDWDDRARAVNIPVNDSPAVGAIAQWNGGGLGHLAYVEEVHGATVIVSESNWSGYWLHRREMPASEVENFIHFKDVGSVTALAPAPATSTKAIGTPDFDGDGFPDVFRVSPDGVLYLYRGNGNGGWATGTGTAVGSGWSAFSYVIAPGDFNGGGRSDVIGITRDGTMRLYTGNGAGGWADGSGVQIGSGWTGLRAAFSPGDFTGDPHRDIIAVRTDGSMHVYAGNGAGGWATGSGAPIGSGWNTAKAVFSPGDFNGDGKSDVLGVAENGTLNLYTGNGASGFANGAGQGIGTGWGAFTALTSPGDFTKDATSDVLGVGPDGAMYLYRGNGTGGWLTGGGELIGSGF